MTEHWIDRMSDYLDGELSDDERAALEEHVEACDPCAATLADLRGVVARAAALEDTPPERDLWPGIAARLGERRAVVVPLEGGSPSSRRFSFSMPQLAAAVVAALLIGVAGSWLAIDSRRPAGSVAEGPAATSAPGREVGERAGSAPIVAVGDEGADASYAAAVAELESELARSRDRLDPETLRTVEQNLAIIDAAIQEIRGALAEDPDDPYLNRHLATTMQRKVDVLRQATQAAI